MFAYVFFMSSCKYVLYSQILFMLKMFMKFDYFFNKIILRKNVVNNTVVLKICYAVTKNAIQEMKLN